MKSARKLTALAVLAATLAVGQASAQDNAKGEKGGGRKRDQGPTPVRVTPAASSVTPRDVSIIAMLNGRRQADVYSKVVGRVTTLGPAEGERVTQGQLLFRIDRSDPGETYLNTPVVSPLTGWIGRWRVTNVGEQVSTTDPVVTVVDDVALRSIVNLPASDWLLVKKDTKVVAELGGEKRPATIQTISVSADPASGRGSVTIEIPNPNRDWRVGMFATVTLSLQPKKRMLLSASSLTITDKGTFVYIADGEIAHRVPVKYNVIDSDTVEITSGLAENAQVISAGGNLIGDGSPIKVLSDTDKDKDKPAKTEAEAR
jgi:multidrug efflux pump subunit AcrA (membrane-fusion protein)